MPCMIARAGGHRACGNRCGRRATARTRALRAFWHEPPLRRPCQAKGCGRRPERSGTRQPSHALPHQPGPASRKSSRPGDALLDWYRSLLQALVVRHRRGPRRCSRVRKAFRQGPPRGRTPDPSGSLDWIDRCRRARRPECNAGSSDVLCSDDPSQSQLAFEMESLPVPGTKTLFVSVRFAILVRNVR
jgi:hypothetical protein